MSMPSSVARTPNCSESRARVGDLGRVQQGLGRDAADVQAGAAELALLDQADREPELGRPQRAGVAAAARAQNETSKLSVRPSSPVLRSSLSGPSLRPADQSSLHQSTWRPPVPRAKRRCVPSAKPQTARAHWSMGWMDRVRGAAPHRLRRPGRTGGSTTVRASGAADEAHLREFATTRRGVEGFVEPRTAVSDVTLLLVAHDGEWTRRRVPSVRVGAPVLPTTTASRPTTPRWSASRSGCASTTGAARSRRC